MIPHSFDSKFAIVLVIQFEPTSQISKFMTTLEIFQVGFFFSFNFAVSKIWIFFPKFYQFIFNLIFFKNPFFLVTTMQNSPGKNPTHILGIYLCPHDSKLHELLFITQIKILPVL
jgi:hypothetical protein